jgi:hypothetical protein
MLFTTTANATTNSQPIHFLAVQMNARPSVFHLALIAWVTIIMSSSPGDALATSNDDHHQNNADESATADSWDNAKSEIPLLPMSDPNEGVPSIRLGETIRFEEWGPIILNSDGEWNGVDFCDLRGARRICGMNCWW